MNFSLRSQVLPPRLTRWRQFRRWRRRQMRRLQRWISTRNRQIEVRVPMLRSGRKIGLGDLIKGLTKTAGIKPCSGCQKRAQALNRRLVFSGGANRKSRGPI
jgi:hypothetical protein